MPTRSSKARRGAPCLSARGGSAASPFRFCSPVVEEPPRSKTLTRTICSNLDVDRHDEALATTQRAFNTAASCIARVCWEEDITNTNTAHHRVYGETRERFGL